MSANRHATNSTANAKRVSQQVQSLKYYVDNHFATRDEINTENLATVLEHLSLLGETISTMHEQVQESESKLASQENSISTLRDEASNDHQNLVRSRNEQLVTRQELMSEFRESRERFDALQNTVSEHMKVVVENNDKLDWMYRSMGGT